MGLHVAALDVGEDKLSLARELGAEIAVDGRSPNAAPAISPRPSPSPPRARSVPPSRCSRSTPNEVLVRLRNGKVRARVVLAVS